MNTSFLNNRRAQPKCVLHGQMFTYLFGITSFPHRISARHNDHQPFLGARSAKMPRMGWQKNSSSFRALAPPLKQVLLEFSQPASEVPVICIRSLGMSELCEVL